MTRKNSNDLILASATIFASIAAILLITATGDDIVAWTGSLFLRLFGLPFVTIAAICMIAGLVQKSRSKRLSSDCMAQAA